MAIKKIAMKLGKYTEGANFTALREIKLLQELKHEHIIEVGGCTRAAVWLSCQPCYAWIGAALGVRRVRPCLADTYFYSGPTSGPRVTESTKMAVGFCECACLD